MAIKWNDVPICATAQMNLENIMLSDRSEIPKSHMLYYSIFQVSRIAKSTETESRLMTAREEWGVITIGYSIWDRGGDGSILELKSNDVYVTLQIYEKPLNCTV